MGVRHNIVVKIFKEIYKLSTVMPLYESESKILDKIARKYDVAKRVVYSIRNLSRIQHEILHPRLTSSDETKIDKRIDEICDAIDNKYELRRIFRNIDLPAKIVAQYLIIKLGNRENLVKIINDFNMYEISSNKKAKEFEILIENYLIGKNISFKNEVKLKAEGITDATPDVLLINPLKFTFQNRSHTVYWIDAKNYFFCNVGFIKKSLKKQATKYDNKFGQGLFIFSHGYDIELADTFLKTHNTLIISYKDFIETMTYGFEII